MCRAAGAAGQRKHLASSICRLRRRLSLTVTMDKGRAELLGASLHAPLLSERWLVPPTLFVDRCSETSNVNTCKTTSHTVLTVRRVDSGSPQSVEDMLASDGF